MTTAVRQPPHHDKLTCYTDYGCRLPECKERYNAYRRDRRKAEQAGTWEPFTDAKPVREHLLKLQTVGIGAHRVAALTGLPYHTVREFLHHSYGNRRSRRSRTTHETAAKILAISAEGTLPGFTDATATRRRIQALVAIGWPMSHLGHHLGVTPKHVWKITAQRYVYHHTATAVADMYPQLVRMRPQNHGVGKREVNIARRRAAANRWPTPKYWADRMDVIGDPDFEPLYGVTRGELIAADARELFGYGVTVEVAAARLGVTRNHLQQELLRHPETAEAVAA